MSEASSLIRVALSLGLVTGLILLVGWFMKKSGVHRRWHSGRSIDARLEVKSSLLIDPRRRLVLVRCDQREHLLLLGPTQDLLIESADAKTTDVTTKVSS